MTAFPFINWTDSQLANPIAVYNIDFATSPIFDWHALEGALDQVTARALYVSIDNTQSDQTLSVLFDNLPFTIIPFERKTLTIPSGSRRMIINADPLNLLTCTVIFAVQDLSFGDTVNYKGIQQSGSVGTVQPISYRIAGYIAVPTDNFSIQLFVIGAGANFTLPDPTVVGNGYSIQGWCASSSTANVTVASAGVGPPSIDGAATFTLFPGDQTWFVTDGTNWQTEQPDYFKNGIFTLIAGGANNPTVVLYNTNAAAVGAGIPQIELRGKNDGGAQITYAFIDALTPAIVAGAERGTLRIVAKVAGVDNAILQASNGIVIGNPTSSFLGLGTLNTASEIAINGVGVCGPLYIACDQQASGTGGGSSGAAGAFQQVRLNTELVDQIGIGLAANVMTPPAGTYRAHIFVVGGTIDIFQGRLQNTTGGVTLVNGSNADAQAGNNDAVSTGSNIFTLAAGQNVELQRRVTTANLVDGGGSAATFGTVETYSHVILEKVA
jgi:hypothetical protein